jgi:glutamyl-tRNA synthetase
LLAWLSIRSRRGHLTLRIEDIDSPRVKAGAAEQALDDLRWLGIDWDEGPYVQSQRLMFYRQALEQLRAAERVYPCTCSRSDVLDAASAPHVGQEGPIYPGTCSYRHARDANVLTDPYVWRFRASSATRELDDRFVGPQSCSVARDLGDFVIAKQDGSPAYQLAVVVDDHAMGVTEVLRGDDLLPSAFRQLDLYEFFGWSAPAFAHVPLVVGPDGRRLAKRHGDTRLATLRAQGVKPEQLVGLLAKACGLQPTATPCRAADLIEGFDLARVPRQPFIFTPELARGLHSAS